jgi:ribosomal protein L7/L12
MTPYMADDARAAATWRGFRMAHLFPVEGDSAIAELWHDEQVWADVRLDGVRPEAHGEDRTASATAVVRCYARPAGADPGWRAHHLDEILAQLTAARDWLLDNEHGRIPVDGGDDLSAAGRALTAASVQTIERLIGAVPTASSPELRNAGTGALAVVLVDEGPTPIELIRRIRQLTGWGLMDSRTLLAARPSAVMTGLSAADAAAVGRSLEAAGATIEIR